MHEDREYPKCTFTLILGSTIARIGVFTANRFQISEIILMLEELKQKGIYIGLISNCFSEEVEAIKASELFPYFDAVCLSFEQGLQKPEKEIFMRCMEQLSVSAEECIYVGDGGSFELETASQIGMQAVQAVWYLKEGTIQPARRKQEFIQVETPFDILKLMHS